MEAQASALRPEEKNWGMLAHLLTLLGYVVLFGHSLPPLVIYLAQRNESPFVADQAKEALNFQLTLLIVGILSVPALCLVITIPFIFLLWITMAIAQLVLPILAAVRASEGVLFRYPCTLRLVS